MCPNFCTNIDHAIIIDQYSVYNYLFYCIISYEENLIEIDCY